MYQNYMGRRTLPRADGVQVVSRFYSDMHLSSTLSAELTDSLATCSMRGLVEHKVTRTLSPLKKGRDDNCPNILGAPHVDIPELVEEIMNSAEYASFVRGLLE